MKQRRKRALTLAKFVVSAGLIYLLYRKTPIDSISALLLDVDIRFLIPVAALLFSNTVLSAVKWRLFLLADGVELGLGKLTVSYLIGSFYNMFLPSNIGGDSYRIYDIAKRSRQTARTAVSVLADRVSGFLAMITIGLVSSLAVGSRFGSPLFFLVPLGVLVAMAVALYMLFKQWPVRSFLQLTRLDRIELIRKIADKLLLSVSCYGANRLLLVRVMVLSFLFQFSVFFIVFLLSRAIHADLPFIYFCTFVPLIALLEVLPVSINGIGLRDAGYVFFFGSVGMTDIETRSLALLFLAMSVAYSMFGGFVFLFRTLFDRADEA